MQLVSRQMLLVQAETMALLVALQAPQASAPMLMAGCVVMEAAGEDWTLERSPGPKVVGTAVEQSAIVPRDVVVRWSGMLPADDEESAFLMKASLPHLSLASLHHILGKEGLAVMEAPVVMRVARTSTVFVYAALLATLWGANLQPHDAVSSDSVTAAVAKQVLQMVSTVPPMLVAGVFRERVTAQVISPDLPAAQVPFPCGATRCLTVAAASAFGCGAETPAWVLAPA